MAIKRRRKCRDGSNATRGGQKNHLLDLIKMQRNNESNEWATNSVSARAQVVLFFVNSMFLYDQFVKDAARRRVDQVCNQVAVSLQQRTYHKPVIRLSPITFVIG
jgi:hypothetical protein